MSKISVSIREKPIITVTDDDFIYNITLGRITKLDGSKVGFVNIGGYLVYKHEGKMIKVHRKIYEVGTGLPIPKNLFVCHKSGCKTDNRFRNLHLGTNTQNQEERGKQQNNISGHKNIRRFKKKWRVDIQVNGIKNYYGYYENINDAIIARNKVIDQLNLNGHRFIVEYPNII